MFGYQNVKAQRQRGVAAVEFAIILPLLIGLLAFPFFFGRVSLYYSVAQKAAQNAAAYLATVPKVEMHDNNKSAAARDMAEEIVNATIAELGPGELGGIGFVIECDGGACGVGAVPEDLITVKIRITMYDEYFPYITWVILGDGPLVLDAKATVKYLGQ
ncbi:MAG: TadE/TadG family type IV pilus assembly protein [Sideroxyarcus sp.]|nr:TadE/TadG family type IV pilus assembly protein [Sideroxyarcus sp.]